MTTQHYKHLSRAFVPAFVHRETRDLMPEEVIDARVQSADHRYTCEVLFSRQKNTARMLKDRASPTSIRHLNAAWFVGLEAANFLGPLWEPRTWQQLDSLFEEAIQLRTSERYSAL